MYFEWDPKKARLILIGVSKSSRLIHAFTVRRNRFAARVAADGIQLVHDEPSSASLAEIPEVELHSAKRRRNPFVKQIDPSALQMHVRRGRPSLGDESGPTVTRSVRLPVPLAKALELLAKHEGITVHALMRMTLASRVRAELMRSHVPAVARDGRATRPPARGARKAQPRARGRTSR